MLQFLSGSVLQEFILYSLRINEVRLGSIVGKDEFGNQYFENRQYFYGKCMYANVPCGICP